MKNKLILLLAGILFPLLLLAQKSDTLKQAWDKVFSTPTEIINRYEQIQKGLTPEASTRNTCYLILKSGEYITRLRGEGSGVSELLNQITLPELNQPTVMQFMEEENMTSFVDYYFMIKELKNGVSFDDARDGLSPSTSFPGRSLNRYDYNKLETIFKGSNERLKSIYLEKFKSLFRNDGCSDQMKALKPVIEKHIPDSPRKKEVLDLFEHYGKLHEGQPAPTPVLKDATGKEYSFKDFSGKVIVVDVWATWCCVCLEKMPAFMQLRDEFKDNDNVVFLTVSIDRKSAHAKWLKAIKDNNMEGMLNLIPDLDEESPFETAYSIPSVPRHIVIDQNGNIVSAYAPSPGPRMKEMILNTLKKAQEGTRWETLSFQEALAKSKDTGKKLFVDCYTKTCGPCKYMVKAIFPLKEVGEYFNTNYVCIMKDMEEGDGIEIGKKYNVQVYPTYLLLNADGSIYCRLDGGAVSSPEEDFVQKVKDAIELTELNKKYLDGTRDQAFLEKYIAFLQTHDRTRLQKVMSETMPEMGVKKLCEPQNWNLIKNEITDIDSPLFRYLLNNRKSFAKKIGQKEVEEKIMSAYRNEFRVFKMMGIDYEKRMADLKQLEKDAYRGARSLRYCMLFRHIIDNKLEDRTNDILDVLQNGIQKLDSPEEKIAITEELYGFEQLATPQQKDKTYQYLKEISKNLPSDYAASLDRIIGRFSRK